MRAPLPAVYLPDAASLSSQLQAAGARLRPEWALSCIYAHPDWRHVYWDQASAAMLLREVRRAAISRAELGGVGWGGYCQHGVCV